jgi:hypothetical protein
MRELYERHRFLVAFHTLSTIAGASVGVEKVTTSLGSRDGLARACERWRSRRFRSRRALG